MIKNIGFTYSYQDNGKNYLNDNQLPKDWRGHGLVGSYGESAYWMANKTGLLDLALAAGLVYVE